jgi:hypothetical protein
MFIGSNSFHNLNFPGFSKPWLICLRRCFYRLYVLYQNSNKNHAPFRGSHRNNKQVATSGVPVDTDPTTTYDPVMAARTPALPVLAIDPPSAVPAPSAAALDANPTAPSPTHPDPMVPAVSSSPLVPPVVDYNVPVPVASPAADALCSMFQQYMATNAEFQHRSTIDAPAFRQTMADGLLALKTGLCSSLVEQLKTITIEDKNHTSPAPSNFGPPSNLFDPPVARTPIDHCTTGQYYPAPTDDKSSSLPVDQRPDTEADSRYPWDQDHGNPFTALSKHPFLQVASKYKHCSKFKTYLSDLQDLPNDSLVSLERFVNGIKGALQAALSSHNSFDAYADWFPSYSVRNKLCPPSLHAHPRYLDLTCNVDACGQMLFIYLTTPYVISSERAPLAYHELVALRSESCGWSLFQAFVCAYSPHLGGSFRDYRLQIHSLLPIQHETILDFYKRPQDLAQEISLSRDASGIAHDLLHHYVVTLRANGDSGFTRTILTHYLRQIKQVRRNPQHIHAPIPFTFYDLQVELRDAGVTSFVTPHHDTLAIIAAIQQGPSLPPSSQYDDCRQGPSASSQRPPGPHGSSQRPTCFHGSRPSIQQPPSGTHHAL